MQVATAHEHLIDFALSFAGYPTNKAWGVQDAEARAILSAPLPVDIVQYKEVFFCSPAIYAHWTSALETGSRPTGTRYVVVEGGHEDAKNDFGDTDLDLYERFWNSPCRLT